MGLEHKIAIISQNSNESIISSNMNSVTVPNVIIQYIGDSSYAINRFGMED